MEISSTQKFLQDNNSRLKHSLVVNLGCPKNQVEAEKLCYVLRQNGINVIQENNQEYNAVWINTCCFVDSARQETFETIAQYYDNENIEVIIFGCFATKYGELLKQSFPKATLITNKDFLMEDHSTSRILSNPYSAYLKIAEGCNRSCKFCIIPSIKGPFVSYSEEKILHEATLIKQSYPIQEIILIAQDTQAYGSDQASKNINLLSLVKKLDALNLFKWIRVMYLFPTAQYEYLDELLSVPSVVPYIDIPLQHTVPRILSSMNRPDDIDKMLYTLHQLRKKYQDLTIRSTFIVGYPGEKLNDFESLCQTLEAFKFDRAGFFAYSDEKDAPSSKLKDKVDDHEKNRRLQHAYALQESISLTQNNHLLHKQLPVLLESWNPINRIFCGRTPKDAPEIDQHILISAPSPSYARKLGSIITATVTKAHPFHIEGIFS